MWDIWTAPETGYEITLYPAPYPTCAWSQSPPVSSVWKRWCQTEGSGPVYSEIPWRMSEILRKCVVFSWAPLCHFLFTPEMTVFITSLSPTGAEQFPLTLHSIVVCCLRGSCAQCLRSVKRIVIVWKFMSHGIKGRIEYLLFVKLMSGLYYDAVTYSNVLPISPSLFF